MKFVFNNKGTPYVFTDKSCGGGQFCTLYYGSNASFNLRSVDLLVEHVVTKKFLKRILIAKYRIEIGYQIFTSQKDINYITVDVADNEVDNAKEIVNYLKEKIKQYEEYRKPIEADNEIYNMKTVPVIDVDGKTYVLDVSMQIDDELKCLFCGGKTYHTHLSCFRNWTVEMRKNFKGWQIITLEEAKKSNLKKCSFCDEDDKITLNDLIDEEEFDIE